MREFKTLVIFGVGVIIGIIGSHYCTRKPTPPKREAKQQPSKLHVVATGRNNAARGTTTNDTLAASQKSKTNADAKVF